MKAKIHQITFLFCIFLLAVSCEEDSGTQSLPEGCYPLEIAAVTLGVEGGDAQPWTRVAETADGMGSEFRPGDAIAVSMNGEVATYTYDGNGWTSEQPLYWQQAGQTAEVAAWHPATDAPIDFTHQDQGLAYLLKADAATATAGQPVSLTFRHQLAKVRVTLSGTQAGQVDRVEVNNYTQCTHTQGGSVTPGAEGWIAMHRVDAATYEANIVPDEIDDSNFIRLNSTALATNLTGILAPLEAGKMYTIDLTVGEPVTDITAENCQDIKGDGYYRVGGNLGQTITVTGGNPTIYLENANINVGSGNAIHITSGNPTIHVQGTSSISSGDGAGIYVAQGNTVTITGDSRDEQLTVRGGNGSPGIGGYIANDSNINCGNIKITNVSVIAYGSTDNISNTSSGIGNACEGATCGTITIENATVHAYGVNAGNVIFTPGIGNGYLGDSNPSLPVVNISNDSEVHVHRGGGNADYIGYPAVSWNGTSANNDINLGGGSCTSSTVYCYTGNGDTIDKTVVYDAAGNATEQPQ